MSAFLNGLAQGTAFGIWSNTIGRFGCFGMPFTNPFMGWSCWSMPSVFMPSCNFGWFTPYNDMPQMPTFSFSQPVFTQNSYSFTNLTDMPWQTPSFNMQNYSQPLTWGDTFVRSSSTSTEAVNYTAIARADGDYDKMLAQILKSEGGYVANDNGSASNKGIKQETYDSYRERKGLKKKDVKDITDEEVKDIYYNDYYLASGADKIEDARLAFYVFDTAVNMGVSRAKTLLSDSGDDSGKFEKLRLNRYEYLAVSNPEKYGDDLEGWKNRLNSGRTFVNDELA